MTGRRWSGDRVSRGLLAALVILLLGCRTTAALAATAEPRAEPFRLIWSSSAGCGNAQGFLAELAGRTTLLREAERDEHAVTLIVETFPASGGVKGQLTVRKPDGDLTVREVPGVDCREVEAAMALIAALMVDPLAGDLDRGARRRSIPPASLPPSAPPPNSAWSLSVEQRLTARTAVAPKLTWGQGVGVMLTHEASSVRPSVGLSAHLAQATVEAPEGSADLEWAAAELTVCPGGLRAGGRGDLRLCGAFQLGRLQGRGFRTARPATKSILWSSASLELEGRYQVVGPLWFGAEAALAVPFSRERFYLEPQRTLHRVPRWALAGGVGLGVRFF